MLHQRVGLTLIEILVALILLSVGALGLAASSAVLTRQMTANLLRSRSAREAANRNEMAQASPCTSITGGAQSTDGLRSRWSVGGGQVRLLEQEIDRMSIPGLRTDHYFSAIPCG